MYDSSLQNARQVRRFSIRQQSVGWEVLEQDESHVRRRFLLNDWHRVERALQMIKTEEAALQKRGWLKTA